MSDYFKRRMDEIKTAIQPEIDRKLLEETVTNRVREEERERFVQKQAEIALEKKLKSIAGARAGYVYFVRVGTRVKIGFSTDPQKRLVSIQTGCPDDAVIVAVVPGLEETETFFHMMFAGSRIRGEWFELSADILRFIENAPKVEITKRRASPALQMANEEFSL